MEFNGQKIHVGYVVKDQKGDPGRRGTYRIREYKQEWDNQNVEDEHLPFAAIMHPTTSAATQRIGGTPQLYPGCRVMFVYMPDDYAELFPIIIGTLPRGDIDDDAKDKKKQDQETGGKIKKPGPDNTAFAGSDPEEKKAFPEGASVWLNQTIGQKPPKLDPTFPESPNVEHDTAKQLGEVREKFAKNADKPTTASYQSGEKDLTKIIQQVDPQGKAQVMPELYRNLQKMSGLMKMGTSGSSGTGSGGLTQPSGALPAGTQVVLNDSFTGALCILIRKYGFELVIAVMNAALINGGINNINPMYQNIILNAMSNIIRLALYFGPSNIPVSQYDETIYGDIVPSPLVLQSQVPDYYLKQYYSLDNDPYPGYIEWVSPDGTQKVWVRREPKTYVFSSASEEIYSISEREIAASLDQFFIRSNGILLKSLKASDINTIMDIQANNVQVNSMNNNMGNNTGGGGGGGNMANMLQGMLGQLMGLLQQLTGEQLPKSVLQTGEIQKVMEGFQHDMAINGQLEQLLKQAVGGGNPLGMLSGLGGMNNIMGAFGMGGGGLQGLMGGLMGGGSFGGNSSGGGGGAGSGFGGATGGGTYTGGDISPEGLTSISETLRLLGIS